ncbi:reverse transcriptase domain-containing protein [Tanacetum coccineum]
MECLYKEVEDKIFPFDEPSEEMGSESFEVPALKDEEFAQIVVLGLGVSFPNGEALSFVLRKHANAFAWVPVDMIGIPFFVAEHELKTYPHIEPRVQRKRSISPDRRKVVKEEVEEWPKSGIMKRVRTTLEGRVTHPRIRASTPEEVPHEITPGKVDEGKDGLVEAHVESKPPKKVLRKHADAFAWVPVDMIRIPCFVAEHELKTYPHIEPRVQRKRSIAPDRRKVVKEEVEEWPKSRIMKRVRLVDIIFEGQIGRNLEAYVDDMVIKNKTEQDLLKDIEETLLTLKKAAERVIPCLDTLKKCTNKKDFRWTEVAEEAFQSMKKLIAELPTLTAPMKDEELLVYLSAASKAVSAVLLVERRGRQMPIHYMVETASGKLAMLSGSASDRARKIVMASRL